MSPGPIATAHRGGYAAVYRGQSPVRPTRTNSPHIASAPPAHEGRGNASLYLADHIIAQARAAEEDKRIISAVREDVTPEMEPESPSLTDEEEGEDFEENEDVTPELEPFDPTIESTAPKSISKESVEENADGSVTITPDAGEMLDVTTTVDGDVIVHVEDEPS